MNNLLAELNEVKILLEKNENLKMTQEQENSNLTSTLNKM
jgi:hypothetical protein